MKEGNGNGTNGKTRRAISDLSPDAITLRKRLEALSPGDTVSYAELTGLVGGNVQTVRHGALYRARAILLREKSFVFAAVRGEGLKRLSDEDIARSGVSIFRRVRKATTRGMRTLACIGDFNRLTAEAQISHNLGMSALAVLHQFVAPARLEKLEAAVKEQKAALPSAKVLEMFARS